MKTDMRVILTKRLLREGLLSLLKEKPLSRITVTDLCQASGVNRATFYNHYETVPMILRDILREYAEKIEQTFRSEMSAGHSEEAALEASRQAAEEAAGSCPACPTRSAPTSSACTCC